MRISDWSSDVCSSDLVAYSQDFSTGGGVAPYSYALGGGALPPGMALSPAGVLAGTPTASGSFAFDLQVTDSSGGTPATGTASYTLAVNAPTITLTPATLPGGTVDAAYSQARRSEEHTSELQSLMRSSYAVFCLK